MPDGRQRMTLGDACADGGTVQTGPFGSQLHAEDYVLDGVPVVMPVNIGDGRIEAQGIARVDEADAMRLARHRLRAGDIVYSRRGDITRRGLVRQEEIGWLCGTGCLLVRAGRGVDPGWLSYWLATPWVHDWLRSHAVGATMPNLNTGILSALPVELPSLGEQLRIAGVLGALDDLVDTNQRLQEALAHQRFATIAYAVSSASDSTAFGEIAELVRIQVSPEDVASNTPYLGLEHFAENAGGLLGLGSTEGLESIKCRFETGDVLYGKLRPYFRKVVRPNFDGVCSTEIWVLRPNEDVSSEYLEWVASTQEFTDFAMAGSTGTRMPRANWDHVRTFAVRKPSGEDFVRAVAASRVMWEQYWALHDENEALGRARDQLLPVLLSGQIWVEDVAA